MAVLSLNGRLPRWSELAGRKLSRSLVGSLLVASAVTVIAAGCGSTTMIQGAGTQPTVTQTVIQQPQAQTKPTSSRPPVRSGLRSCGGNLSANPHTSCPFAKAVYGTVAIDNGSRQGTYSVYSSVTGRYYSMTC